MNDRIKTYKTKNGKRLYRFQIYVGKNQVTGSSSYVRKRGFTSLKEAQQAYKKTILDIKKGVYTKREKHNRVNDLVKLWLRGYQPTVRESTYASTLRLLHNHILPSLGNIYLDKLTTAHCMKAVQDWFKAAPKTVRKIVAYCNLILNKGVVWGMLDKNPMVGVDIPKLTEHVQPKKNKDFYTKQELNKYLTCAKKTASFKVYTYFRLAAYSGMRRGEELALTWSDIDFTKQTISINKTLAQGKNNRLMIDDPKTQAGYRVITIDPQTLNVLSVWKQKQARDLTLLGFKPNKSDQLVFSTEKNTWYHPAMVAQWNTTITKKNGLRHIRPHGFRHTHATLLQNAGVTAKDAQARLGHSDIRTTLNTYTHETQERQRLAAKEFSNYMDEKEPTKEPNIKLVN